MADNRADTRVSMRTPLARVKGLGASGHGVEHWWLHRMTAVSNVPLIVAFVIIVASLAGRSHAEALRIVSNPLVAIITGLGIVLVTWPLWAMLFGFARNRFAPAEVAE